MNHSDFQISHFIIVGFPAPEDMPSRIILFTFFLLIYVLTLLENSILLLIIRQDAHLHSPMYLFICNLAVLDMCLPSVTVPQVMHQILRNDKFIDFLSCIIQMGSFICFNVIEGLLLGVMAYDRYQAICKPLHYPLVMNNMQAVRLAAFCWVPGIITGFGHLWAVLTLPFCGPNKIFNYYCEHMEIIKLSCTDVSAYSIITVAAVVIVMFVSICLILLSYIKILIAAIKVTSSEGLQKAFSTCASHLIVISLFLVIQGGLLVSKQMKDTSINVSVLAGFIPNIIPPLMNPIIYCLKTSGIRTGLIKLLKQ
ncbi:olfactory receptor 2A12-like [Protopterus annectens]|uniref:olfactory receptor 2A12-like n=1 Tax=Protopterus annectens TaxID=7888 RepID=UPI001CFA2F99|nr:olfactory receptor 2A12-like [Protopterus annectens]